MSEVILKGFIEEREGRGGGLALHEDQCNLYYNKQKTKAMQKKREEGGVERHGLVAITSSSLHLKA